MKNLCITLLIGLFCGPQTTFSQEYPFEVTVYGSGEPILFVPGFSCPGEVWETTVETLRKEYELHVFTLAGFGGVKPVDFPWLPQIKKGMENYIRDKGLQKPKFVGHSMGGTLGLWLAADNPMMFSKVISVDGLPAMGALMFPDYNPSDFGYDTPYNQQALAMTDEQFMGMAAQFANGMTLREEKKPQIVEWMEKADRKTYLYGYTDLLKLDLRKALGRIRTPVTVFAATEPYGIQTVKNTIENQFGNLQDYTLILAEDSAHFIMFDRPEWFNGMLIEELTNK
ncbi:MAG: alpha/beta hydrolase [Sediminicola sp.]